jgi:hypothetical protein
MSGGIVSRNPSIFKDVDNKWKTRVDGDLTITDGGAATPAIYNVSAPISGTEYSQALSTGTKKFLIRVRGNADLQLAFTNGDSSTTFITIPAGASYKEDSLNLSSLTLYFQCNKASQTVEILEWS